MPGYGYGDADRRERRERSRERDGSRSRSRGQKRRKGEKDDKKAKGKKRHRRRDEGALDSAPAEPAPAPASAAQDDANARRGAWRNEIEKRKPADSDDDKDMDSGEGDEDDVNKMLAASRARREALIAKWVNRGEIEGEASLTMPTSGDGLEPEGDQAEPESDGETEAFFEKQRKEKEEKAGEGDEEAKALNRFIQSQKAEHDGDMFGDVDAEGTDVLNKAVDQSATIGMTGASGDDWNDGEGYYRAKIGELMADRYLVVEDTCGKGVFSNVVKAKDQKENVLVAIKIMRCNDMMKKAAEKEVEVLHRLNRSDKHNTKNVIRLLTHFMYRDHLCLVFECMWDNLRVALKKYTKDKGMSLRAVRAYTKQLLVALQHIHRNQLIHADIKPDNILISAGHNLVKICDLGSTVELTEIEPTPYLVSRFYRAPEIVLGAKYGPQADTFALGATLAEIFTGKILFPGRSNNDMIRHFMELKGKIPVRMIKSGTPMIWKTHFNEEMDFRWVSLDKMTRKTTVKIITDCSAKKSMLDLVMARVGAEKQKSDAPEDQWYVKKAKEFADLLTQMTTLDPEKRASPSDLLEHPFVAEDGAHKKKKDNRAQAAAKK